VVDGAVRKNGEGGTDEKEGSIYPCPIQGEDKSCILLKKKHKKGRVRGKGEGSKKKRKTILFSTGGTDT